MLSSRSLGRFTTRSCGKQRSGAATNPSLKARQLIHRSYSSGLSRGDDQLNAHGGNRQSTLSRVLTYGALATTTALVAERWYYGSPAKRNQEKDSKKSTYGTPDDFLKAIDTLRQDLSHIDGGVSTDPDDLHAHGFSANDYHPGTVSLTLCPPP